MSRRGVTSGIVVASVCPSWPALLRPQLHTHGGVWQTAIVQSSPPHPAAHAHVPSSLHLPCDEPAHIRGHRSWRQSSPVCEPSQTHVPLLHVPANEQWSYFGDTSDRHLRVGVAQSTPLHVTSACGTHAQRRTLWPDVDTATVTTPCCSHRVTDDSCCNANEPSPALTEAR